MVVYMANKNILNSIHIHLDPLQSCCDERKGELKKGGTA